MATLILLARHGETDWNRERRVQGHTDIPLNATGLQQAEDLGAWLAETKLNAVYASDLARALATALVVAQPRGLEVVTVPELRERDFGTWEGLTDDEARRRFPAETSGPRTWGDAESPEKMAARVLAALRTIGAANPDGTVLVVSHGGPLQATLRHIGADGDRPLENGVVVSVAVENGALRGVD